jgi:aryl-alcohol dehydrogenase-like predicted oxidoreductase
MEMRRAGKSGLELSRLGLGTMTWGRDTDTHEAAEQMRSYVEAGGNFIDTAASYGDGDAERIIGGLVGTFVTREQIVIASKAGVHFPQGVRTINNSRHHLISELDKSLSRLGTDYLDIWQVHTWDGEVALEDTLSALDFAYTTGKARYVGISNFNGWQSSRAISLQEANTAKAPIATMQVEYSLLSRTIEGEILECAQSLGVGILAWSPLGRGVLTGKYRNSIPADSRGATPHFANFISSYLNRESAAIVEAVVAAASGLGYSPLEVALAWVRDAPGVTSAIVGARTGAQLRGALTVEEVVLPDVVRTALDEISRRF